MVKKRIRNYAPKTSVSLSLMGKLIKMQRKLKKMPSLELAQRVGVSRSTIQRIENGDPKCEIGLVFEAAYIVGIDLFHHDDEVRHLYGNTVNQSLKLLPKRVRHEHLEVDNDF